jgi:hypothetical protein
MQMPPAPKLLSYILPLKGCGHCWSAGFSRLKWKYFCSAKDCNVKPGLQMKKSATDDSPSSTTL